MEKRLKIFKIDRISKTIVMTIKTKIYNYSLLKRLISLRKLMILSEDVSLKSSFYSFCGVVFFADKIKFSASNEKMLNGERFITGYTKRRMFVSE